MSPPSIEGGQGEACEAKQMCVMMKRMAGSYAVSDDPPSSLRTASSASRKSSKSMKAKPGGFRAIHSCGGQWKVGVSPMLSPVSPLSTFSRGNSIPPAPLPSPPPHTPQELAILLPFPYHRPRPCTATAHTPPHALCHCSPRDLPCMHLPG